jgi:predicted RNA-binding Zn ribbon-like protein
VTWLGRSCAAPLAHVVCGDPAVTIGRCHAAACGRFHLDPSRNRTRRFCSHTCASRTTVAAYRARRKAAG